MPEELAAPQQMTAPPRAVVDAAPPPPGAGRAERLSWMAVVVGLAVAWSLDALLALVRAFGVSRLDWDLPVDDPRLLVGVALAVAVGGAVASWVSRRFGFWESALMAVLHGLPAAALVWYTFSVSADFVYRYRYAAPGPFVGGAVAVLLGSCIVAWLGASAAYMLGAGGRFDGSFGFELGVARSHLKFGFGTFNALAIVPLVFLVLTEVPDLFLKGAGGLALPGGISPPAGMRTTLDWVKALVPSVLLLFALGRAARDLGKARGHKRPGTVVMSFISIVGVGIGVWALVVVLSVMSGFEGDLKKKILGTNAHAVVLKYTGEFPEHSDVLQKIARVPGVVGASPFIINEVMISSEANISGSVLKGIDPATVGRVTDLAKNVEEGRLDYLSRPEAVPSSGAPKNRDQKKLEEEGDRIFGRREGEATSDAAAAMPAIAIGKEMARGLRVGVGDTINVIAPLGELGPTGPVPKAKPFRVGAVFHTGMYEYDSKFAYIAIPEAQRFFGLGQSVSGIELKVSDIDQAREIKLRILAELEGFPYRAKDWGEMNKNLFSALRLEKLVMFIILTFIVLVASCNILSTLIMMVIEKGKEIAILKSMGSRDGSVMKVFILEGLVIGLVGAVFGVITGLASCRFVERYGIALDPEVYYIGQLPVKIDPLQITLVALVAVLLSYAATIYPAVKASRLPPVEGLRYE